MALDLILLAVALAGASGVPGLGLRRDARWGERMAAGLMGLAAVAGLAGAVAGLCRPAGPSVFFPWPAAGDTRVGLDPLSAFFLVPVFLMGGLGPLYGLGYWPQHRHPGNGRRLRFFWGLLVAGMGLLIISRHALAFLLGWEIMALSAFFLVSTEDHRPGSREAGWIYLAATHVGTLALFALFALWRHATGSYEMQPAGREAMSLGLMNLFFVLALLGFGLKAGVIPLHFWLPGAHAAAPTHVSAMLSGVVLKTGIYGLVRWLSFLPDAPVAWGTTLLGLGMVSGLLGVVFALGQHDLKRLLAYHSVENIGIILMGLGLALLGRATGRPAWVALGLAGGLLHVWNHGLFKALLFLCAGAVVHRTRTRQIDRLGGLARAMPWTAALFLVGAVAICGLPPLNGFVSEWFLYLGLLNGGLPPENSPLAPLVAVPVLALIGTLAVACFVKVQGAVFLGEPRTRTALLAREAPWVMRLPMVVLAAGCVAVGVAPVLVVPVLDASIACWLADADVTAVPLASLAPTGGVGLMAVALLAGIAVPALWLVRRTRAARRGPTWDCGYARPTGRMQYTAGSFARLIVRMFRHVVRPRETPPRVTGLFPARARMHGHVDEVVLDRLLRPAGRRMEDRLAWFRRFQHGLAQHYVLYILLILLALLCTLFSFEPFIAPWRTR